MADLCPYLFIDEAHHLGAQTWSTFKQQFALKHILQFTATPFREDDKLVEGQPIFNYPLKKAQDEGYFKLIQFKPVVEFDPEKADQAIAEKAVKQLRADYNRGHLLMARVGKIERAEDPQPFISILEEDLHKRQSVLDDCVDIGNGFAHITEKGYDVLSAMEKIAADIEAGYESRLEENGRNQSPAEPDLIDYSALRESSSH